MQVVKHRKSRYYGQHSRNFKMVLNYMDNHLYLSALKEHQTGNIDLAEKLYRDILKISPEDANTLHLLSILLAEKREFSDAYNFIKKAIEIDAESSAFHNTMGGILKNLNKYHNALLHYQKSMQLCPNNASTYNNMGNVLYKLEKLEDAKEYYYRAIQLNPTYVDAHCNLS